MTQGSSGVQRVDFSSESGLVNAAKSLLERAHSTDGVEAFSEAFVKELDRPKDHIHWALLTDDTLTALAALAPDGSAELVVEPSARGNGDGTQLAEAVLGARPAAGLWAHGDLPAARALAAHLSLKPTRELLVMSVEGDALARISHSGATSRALADAADAGEVVELSYSESVERWGREAVEQAWLEVNNDAFSWHPEQGGWDIAALHEAMDTTWFDPDGIRFLWSGDSAGSKVPALAGFHWTKRHSPNVGEVYVVGLSSHFRGRGFGDPLMRAGLEHLVAGGAEQVLLYVEADNEPAVCRYESLGFGVAERHKVYSAGA